jgi:hypothetical protein
MKAKKPGEKRRPKKRKTPVWPKAFLAALAKTGNLSRSCSVAKVAPSTMYALRDKSEEFNTSIDKALIQAADVLEDEAMRRARDGLVRYKFYKGEPIIDPRTGEPYYELEYSDTLLIFLLKGCNPVKYRENMQHEHRHGGLTSDEILISQVNVIRPEGGVAQP